jgi:hypothetical protein
MNKEIEVRVSFGMLVAVVAVSILIVSAASAPTVSLGSAIAEEGETGTVPLMCLTVPEGEYTVNVTGFNRTTGRSVVNNTEVITVTPVLSSDTTAPTTEVSAPPDTTPIPSGTALPWTNTTVWLSFNRSDNGGGVVAYTNISLTGAYTLPGMTFPGNGI